MVCSTPRFSLWKWCCLRGAGQAHRGCRSEGPGVPDFWQNLGDYDPAIWIPIAALATQIVVATIITILVLRWQERAVLGRNRAVR